MNLALFVRSSARSQARNSELAHQFFLIFCMKLDTQSFEAWVLKKVVLSVRKAQRVQKKVQKLDLRNFDKNLINSSVIFYMNEKVVMVFQPLSYDSKTSGPIRMRDSLNYSILQTSWCMKLNFCYCWTSVEETNLPSHFKWVGSYMLGHSQLD